MVLKPFPIKKVHEGKNSVLIETIENNLLYEKLANTIHVGGEELINLHKKVNLVEYNPLFESASLNKKNRTGFENLILNVTESCNLSCSYCIFSGKYENERVENNSNMSFDIARKAIDLFMPHAIDPALISFYGGEPMNNMPLVNKVVDYIKNTYPAKTTAFSMTSNFVNADKYLEDIVNNDLYISISLDGPKEIHDKHRNFKDGSPTYEKIMDNLKKFQEFSPNYVSSHLSYNVTYNDINDLPEIIKFFNDNPKLIGARISGIESKGLDINSKPTINSEVFNLISDYTDLIALEKNPGILRGLFDQKLKTIAHRSKDILPKELMLNGCCYPGNRKLFTDTHGEFYICERFGNRLSIGDVEIGLVQDSIDKSIEKFLNIRNNVCTDNCWAQRLCTPCIQSSKDCKKDISEEGLHQTCELNKSQILIALTQYVSLIKEPVVLEKYIKSIGLPNR